MPLAAIVATGPLLSVYTLTITDISEDEASALSGFLGAISGDRDHWAVQLARDIDTALRAQGVRPSKGFDMVRYSEPS